MDRHPGKQKTHHPFPAMSSSLATAPRPTDFQAFSPAQPAITAPRVATRRLPWARLGLGAAGVVAVASLLGGYLYHTAGFETTDDAFLEGDVHPISARINGTVTRVLVDDNAHVRAGDPLVELDPADLNLAVQGAEADLAQARANASQVTAQIARAQAEVAAATARIAQNTAQLNRVQVDFHRMEVLGSDRVGAISKQEFDGARAQFEAAQAAQQSLLAERASAEASLAATHAQEAVAQAQLQKAAAALATAKLQVNYTIIRAPGAGRIARKSVEVGQRLQPGQAMMAVVSDDVWVVANFKESQLAHLRVGQKVEVRVDALDDRAFAGTVESFSPGTGAQFSLLPPDNATGNFTKVVQRLPVKIVFNRGSLGDAAARLAPGLSADVSVSVRP
jgi:membrane fusion protein (multidrug efflux system)